MANLKRNTINLFKEMNGDEAVTQTYFTPPFLPMAAVYEANDLLGKYEAKEQENGTLSSPEIREYLEEMADFVANRVYGKQFTKEELEERLHAPDALVSLRDQVMFVALGVQTADAKKSQGKKS